MEVFDEYAILAYLRAKVGATLLILAKEEEMAQQDKLIAQQDMGYEGYKAIDDKYSQYPEYHAYDEAWKKLSNIEKELCRIDDTRHLSEDGKYTGLDVNGNVNMRRIVNYLMDRKKMFGERHEASNKAFRCLNRHEKRRAIDITRSWTYDTETEAAGFQDEKGRLGAFLQAQRAFDNRRQSVHDPRYGLTDLEKRLCLL
ncbi:UNVERIFIED_CONTAM: hypothetical protein FKN15_005929 [Acipenser sinensis]